LSIKEEEGQKKSYEASVTPSARGLTHHITAIRTPFIGSKKQTYDNDTGKRRR